MGMIPSADINSMKRCFAARLIRSWVFEELGTNGITELTKLKNLLRSQSYWDTLSQTHTACVLMTILWNGCRLAWWYDLSSMSHVALPWIFRMNFAGRQRKTDDRSDGFECVEWVVEWCVGKRENYEYTCIYIHTYIHIYIHILKWNFRSFSQRFGRSHSGRHLERVSC